MHTVCRYLRVFSLVCLVIAFVAGLCCGWNIA